MNEEELAIADQLLSPELHLNETDRQQVKEAARRLLKDLKGSNKLVRDWYKKPDMKSGVRGIIKEVLDKMLPASYSPELYNQLCEEMYVYVRTQYENYRGDGGPISA